MWRNKFVQIISTHIVDIGKLTNRTLSAKTPDKGPKKKCPCPKTQEGKEEKPPGSPCKKYEKKKPDPCNKNPKDDCPKKSTENFSNTCSEMNDYYKTLIPPASVLKLLQSYEIKLDGSSFLTKTTGH